MQVRFLHARENVSVPELQTGWESKRTFGIVYCNLAGPIDPVAKDGYKYVLSFVDVYTGMNMVYFLKQKSNTLEATEKFLSDIVPSGKIKQLWGKNGSEFMSKNFKSLLCRNAIKHEMSAPYSPHQTGTVERVWQSLFDMAHCLFLEANLPRQLWPYAVLALAYIRNRCFNSKLCKTPFDTLTGKQPNIGNMHLFGSTCFISVQNTKK